VSFCSSSYLFLVVSHVLFCKNKIVETRVCTGFQYRNTEIRLPPYNEYANTLN
jgi:hypothetical protein